MTPLLAQRLRTDRSFERLYRRYVADVYHYALAVCRNPADAEDITQTTFMNAYRAVQAGEQPRAPKNWLLAIAHNVMRQRFRSSARRPNEVELAEDIAATVPDDDGYSAEDIRRALAQLNFNQRAALVMRELEGRSYAEIAEILGISVGAVETLIFRARRALREQLEGSLTCNEAELAISRQIDGRLSRADKGMLRAHLRTCADCAKFARSQRAQRAALKGIAAIPLPASLTSLFGGGAAVGTAVAAKAAAVTALGLLVAGGTIETARHVHHRASHAPARDASTVAPIAPAVRTVVSAVDGQPRHAAVGQSDRAAVKPTTHEKARRRGRVVHGAAPTITTIEETNTVVASPNVHASPTSRGSRGTRAHGAPAAVAASRPSVPGANAIHHPAKPHSAAPVARGRSDAARTHGHVGLPQTGRPATTPNGNARGRGKGNGLPAQSPTTTTTAPTDPTEPVVEP